MKKRVNLWLVLPEEITNLIITSLDLKSMTKSMLVCKQWLNLISNHISNDPLIAKDDLLAYDDGPLRFGVLDDKTHQVAWMKPLDDHCPCPFDMLMSSCNGLICYVGVCEIRKICICNPTIGECTSFPFDNPKIVHALRFDLGFCASSNEYKLITFTMRTLEICTLQSPIRWRSVPFEDFYALRNRPRAAIPVYGVLHWLLETGRGIVSFDLAKEVFGSIPVPHLDDGKEIYQMGCMDNCLVVTSGYNPLLGLEIWVRKEDKSSDESVWTKNWVIDTGRSLDQQRFQDGYTWLRPVKLSTDGRIIMTCYGTHVYSYDPRGELVRLDYYDRVQDTTFTSTLVSPLELMQENGQEGSEIENKE